MKREYYRLPSAALGHAAEHLVFGHAGAPVLVFPTSKGRFYQWEDFGMIEALRHPLEQGWLQLFCVDSRDELSWYNFEDPQPIQIAWHLAYEQYLLEEFLPWLRQQNSNPFLILTGVSFGAFHAVNFALRYPHTTRRVVACSGDYDTLKYVEGYLDEEVVANSPLTYLPDLSPDRLPPEAAHLEFRLACGRADFCREPTQALATHLGRLGLKAECHVWEHPGMHDWPLWREQIRHYL